MPAIETADLLQTAVLWEAAPANRHGDPQVIAAVELNARNMTGVRWILKRRDILDSQGNKVAVDGTVVASRSIPPNSLLWLGRLADVPEGGPTSDIMEVITNDVTPDVKVRNNRYEHSIKRYRDALPTIVSG